MTKGCFTPTETIHQRGMIGKTREFTVHWGWSILLGLQRTEKRRSAV